MHNGMYVVAMHKERTSEYVSKSHALVTHSQTPFASRGRCTATCHKARQGRSVGEWETYDIKNRPSCQHVKHVRRHGLPNKDALHRLAMTPHTMAATTGTPHHAPAALANITAGRLLAASGAPEHVRRSSGTRQASCASRAVRAGCRRKRCLP